MHFVTIHVLCQAICKTRNSFVNWNCRSCPIPWDNFGSSTAVYPSEMTYTVSSGTLNSSIPYHPCTRQPDHACGMCSSTFKSETVWGFGWRFQKIVSCRSPDMVFKSRVIRWPSCSFSIMDMAVKALLSDMCNVRRAHASCRICSSVWQQSVALFNELGKHKLINNFNYCLQKHYCQNYVKVTLLSCKAGITFWWNKLELINPTLNAQKSFK